ncbi:hypothetical protein MIZ03_0136 [Rhodoferax lithotrophicus]|uniref:Uncharacterized protein n=1 Tax=Rhodoferax lithotrophicus TaxID=2798804 RepID=A0ABN6D3B0_9BURK|nr:hypothetical protein [Rhodoferax sp. MIZ03]BCO25276.1 hypothetical protein MIZ03_0136 [Rhodoferax sp. MIZ03]
MNEPRIYVDFNEMPTANEVLLSKFDTKVDSSGKAIYFVEGMRVSVYMDDEDKCGSPDNLIAEGIARRNHYGGWTAAARWVVVISERGIRHESEERPHEPPEDNYQYSPANCPR